MVRNGREREFGVLVDLQKVRGPRIGGTIGVNAEVAEWVKSVGRVLDDVKVVHTIEPI